MLLSASTNTELCAGSWDVELLKHCLGPAKVIEKPDFSPVYNSGWKAKSLSVISKQFGREILPFSVLVLSIALSWAGRNCHSCVIRIPYRWPSNHFPRRLNKSSCGFFCVCVCVFFPFSLSAGVIFQPPQISAANCCYVLCSWKRARAEFRGKSCLPTWKKHNFAPFPSPRWLYPRVPPGFFQCKYCTGTVLPP